MDKERIETLRKEKDFDICMDFLTRMIEKYGHWIDICNDGGEPEQVFKKGGIAS